MLNDKFFQNLYQDSENFDHQRKNAWMLTFNDLLSLLVTFFILLYSISDHSKIKIDEIFEKIFYTENSNDNFILPLNQTQDIDYIYHIIQNKIKNHSELKDLYILKYNDKIIISMAIDKVFENYSNILNQHAENILYLLSTILFEMKNEISVSAAANLSSISERKFENNLSQYIEKSAIVANKLSEYGLLSNLKIYVSNLEHNKLAYSDSALKYKNRIDIIVNEELQNKNN